ncbi:MAG: TIR domain-containing protein [Leptolyngbya sp. SIO3F4]|nr:TIR domain-containing protein [Leptolyngbya sp. SIO3F4]
MPPVSSTSSTIKVFISYSHKDEAIKNDLCVHLASLRRQGKIETWHDRAIEAGTEWEAVLKTKFHAADVVLLLVTAEFIASDYCYETEMQWALERHHQEEVRVIPIIMKPCDWQGTPFCTLQFLPQDRKPITTWDNRDEALTAVVKDIRKVVETLARNQTRFPLTPALPDKNTGSSISLADSVFVVGTPITQPRQFFGRQRIIKRLFNLLKTRPLQNAAIIGKKRSGKTSLLNYLQTITITPVEQLRAGQRNDWLPNSEDYRWIFVDFQDPRVANREGFLKHLLTKMGFPIPNPCSLENFMEQVGGRVKQPTVILIDEIGAGLQRCPELDDIFWESLRSWANHYADGNLAFVLSASESPVELARHNGHSSPFFNIFGYTTTLKSLSEPEAKDLIASSPLAFSEEDMNWMLQQSQGWPILLQALCRERLMSLEDQEDDWQEEALQQIKQYKHLLIDS